MNFFKNLFQKINAMLIAYIYMRITVNYFKNKKFELMQNSDQTLVILSTDQEDLRKYSYYPIEQLFSELLNKPKLVRFENYVVNLIFHFGSYKEGMNEFAKYKRSLRK